jgi:hypothetical protein
MHRELSQTRGHAWMMDAYPSRNDCSAPLAMTMNWWRWRGMCIRIYSVGDAYVSSGLWMTSITLDHVAVQAGCRHWAWRPFAGNLGFVTPCLVHLLSSVTRTCNLFVQDSVKETVDSRQYVCNTHAHLIEYHKKILRICILHMIWLMHPLYIFNSTCVYAFHIVCSYNFWNM